ncbi:pyrroline-5-carboxylate reductase [Bacillus suaedaesalsae]|uniref:Pyrroline-5-carboxylate reductase n=1 Tax=Bacillus suaedaesalsae TaxID=2810349 RepID=A0ABS2DIQ8_9BACI|nr:pyrroline-5-carboxylate reductase [Bacillus suaedaesalsae]MBM6618333.1 pyrroline-5-carboxylate reductase [Bacillus suaedaesalsae]
MLKNKKIGFIGAGSMAEAMIAGIVNAKKLPKDHIYVSNKSNVERLRELETGYGIKGVKREELPMKELDIIVLAMKPKDAQIALDSIRNELQPHQLIISVLAGITTSFMEHHLKYGQQVLRVMPNTSSMISESATAIAPGTFTEKSQITIAKELLTCIGKVFEIKEEQMDIFTGIAGSGPAYFYYLMEHMERAGKEGGLDTETTREIMAQTILGAAKMIMEADETPATLRENVTSPNGTTAAGLAALAKHGGGKAITQAIKQASNRSHEISSQLEEKLLPKAQ